MEYYELKTSKNEYKLRLNVRAVVALEKDLGKNPLYVFTNKIPEIEDMVKILYHSLKHYQPETTMDDAYNIFDEWVEDNHIIGEFSGVCVDLYTQSGLFKPQGTEEKN